MTASNHHESWDDPQFEAELWQLYRDFFAKAERKRRWTVSGDIPWADCNKSLDPVFADIVESFCVVELYLPDYLRNAIPMSRPSRARTWFYANWGYEESKHSLALGDWLVHSGARSDSQIADMAKDTFDYPWQVPHESVVAMVVYTMVQERATALTYRNLREQIRNSNGDPALERVLSLLAVDEQAHYDFFRQFLQLFLRRDRDATLEHLRRVMHTFAMPALHLLVDSSQRIAQIKEFKIFDENQYFRNVYLPILASLGVERAEMKDRVPQRKSQ